MSEQLRRLRRSLPWDVLLVLFELADPASLALLGGVSYDFLVATAPHLYRDVILRSLSQIESMFCDREEKSPCSRVNPFLNLESIQSLTLDFLSTPTPSSFVVPELSVDRVSLRCSRRRDIPLDSLLISLPRLFPERYLGSVQISLLNHVDPKLCEYRMELNDPDFYKVQQEERVRKIHEGERSYPCWRRIEVLSFVGIVPFMIPADDRYNDNNRIEIAFLSWETLRQVDMRFDVYSMLGSPHSTAGIFLELLAISHWFRDLRLAKEVTLVVGDQEEKDEVESELNDGDQMVWLKEKCRVSVEER